MNKIELDIDPRIWKANFDFLKDGHNYIAKEEDLYHYKLQKVGKSEQLVDNNESITPTTDKGYLNKEIFFQEVFKNSNVKIESI